MTETIKDQILAIRDSGKTNMFDIKMVQKLALEENFFELVHYFENHKAEYLNFIITGQTRLAKQ